jgi:hypothetical protein
VIGLSEDLVVCFDVVVIADTQWDTPHKKSCFSRCINNCSATVMLATVLAVMFGVAVFRSVAMSVDRNPASSSSSVAMEAANLKVSADADSTLLNARQQIMFIRHAENIDGQPGLSPSGTARAACLGNFFSSFVINRLYAANDPGRACMETLAPLAERLGLNVESNFNPEQTLDLTQAIQSSSDLVVLVAWYTCVFLHCIQTYMRNVPTRTCTLAHTYTHTHTYTYTHLHIHTCELIFV